jgi:thioredoxin reductase
MVLVDKCRLEGRPKGETMDIYDILLVGAGPTGLYGAFYAGMREMRTMIIEALPEPGGQLAVLYPEKLIYDVAGLPRIQAKDLVRNLVEQIEQWHPTLCFSERATGLNRLEEGIWQVTTEKGMHYARTVVIAAGIGAFRPNRLDVPSIAQFEDGGGVHYFVQDKNPFYRKNLLVVGGGDSAVDWALNLKDYAKSVTLIHRREGFRAHESSLAQLAKSNVRVLTHYEIRRLEGGGVVDQAVIFDNRTDEETTIQVDAVLLNLGFKANLGAIKDWGLEFDGRYIRVNPRQETNLPGVYAAGDVCKQTDVEALNLISTGFGQAAMAVNHAFSYITGKSVFPGHSSEMRL